MASRRPKAAVAFAGAPGEAHEWVSFEDQTERRAWGFDVTFLLSRWTCIFGAGCQGVLTGPAPELSQGCCSYGAHFTDDDDVARVKAAAATLTAEQWQYQAKSRRGGLIRREANGTRVTRLVDDACIFLNRPDFEGGPGCALHRAALERGQSPIETKPDVCWQLPLRRHDHVEDDGTVTSTVLQWDRKHWGDGGEEFHWWCTESADAFVGHQPVYLEMADELIALVGADVYGRLVTYLRVRDSSVVPLPHPAVRSRSES
ncbi:MAG: hypothetical protein M3R71_03480 [Actinomycetota bacterium]|nr:hypothetical protein [Actinomycetota bacterium]